MVTLGMLWIPIIGSAVLVFFASALIHMVTPLHKNDFGKLPDEEGFRAAMLKNLPPAGQYVVPYCADMKLMGSAEMVAKYNQGPNALLILRSPGVFAMGPVLGQWFVVCLVTSLGLAWMACGLLPVGSAYMTVFCPIAIAGSMAYGFGNFAHSVWFARPWSVAMKDLLGAVIYGCLTAGMFGWRWPHA